MKKGLIVTLGFFASVFIVIFFLSTSESSYDGKEITVYKSPTCGCCVNYIPYLENEGFKVKVIALTDLSGIKSQYGVPSNMESCHTVIIDNYFVEGHVPLEAIDKLLEEKPDLDGISLPGMPPGSLGMPGIKRGNFVIYGIKGEETFEFMRI